MEKLFLGTRLSWEFLYCTQIHDKYFPLFLRTKADFLANLLKQCSTVSFFSKSDEERIFFMKKNTFSSNLSPWYVQINCPRHIKNSCPYVMKERLLKTMPEFSSGLQDAYKVCSRSHFKISLHK